MNTVINKTKKPLKVPLPGGKLLRLGPGKTGQVSPKALEHPGFQKMVDAGEIEVEASSGANYSAGGGADGGGGGGRASGSSGIRHHGDR
ncbi:MAG: hypothetical protein ACI8QZ_001206 [Chlamydiales bacterium]|jgi:hypothetical protein